ncbi:PAS domain-containing protein [Massilia sp. B-10]|nr:PAS domain-containing protein [Massilia sp. B-10]
MHGFYAMAFDITFRKNSEIAQRESEERLRTITDNLPVLISYKDRDMRFRFANSLYQDWFNKAANEVIGHTALEIYGDERHEERSAHFQRCLQGQSVEFELPVTIRGKVHRCTRCWCRICATAWRTGSMP